MSNIVINGRGYKIEESHIAAAIPYHLVGRLGVRYQLERNIPHPNYLFAMIGKDTVWFFEDMNRKLTEVNM